jgi:hypothetical protein
VNEFIENNFRLILCMLLLFSRLGDVGSTYLVSPTLKLEANPIAKKLGWPFMVLSLLVCLLPYYDTGLAVMALVPSLLVSASNISKFWMVKALGETGYSKMVSSVAAKSKKSHVLFSTIMAAFFIILAGFVLLLLCPDSEGPAFWFGTGIVLYGVITAFYGLLYFRKLFKQTSAPPSQPPPFSSSDSP